VVRVEMRGEVRDERDERGEVRDERDGGVRGERD